MYLFHSPKTTISEIFAIMRQWVPQVQQNIEMLVKEVRRVYHCTCISCYVNGGQKYFIIMDFSVLPQGLAFEALLW